MNNLMTNLMTNLMNSLTNGACYDRGSTVRLNWFLVNEAAL